jgi:hypothetical protein
MNKLYIIIFIIFFLGGLYGSTSKTPGKVGFSQPVRADDAATASADSTNSVETEYVVVDDRQSQRIQKYLQSKGSPYSRYGGVFTYVSVRYNISLELLVAISKIESTWGKHIAPGSHNPFGIMSGGNVRYFDDWIYSIDYLGKMLAEERYYKAWRQDKTNIEALARVYCPPNWEHWAKVVREEMEEIKVEKEILKELSL